MRNIKDLFEKATCDSSTIKDLELLNVKFSKKKNAAIITIKIDKKIKLIDIINLESNAEREYNLDEFKVIPKIEGKYEITEEDVNEAISYLEKDNMFFKGMFDNCNIEIQDAKINIILKMPNSKFLELKKADKQTELILKTFFGQDIVIDISDDKEAEEKFIKLEKEKKLEITELQVKNKEIKAKEQPEKIGSVILGKDISGFEVMNIEDLTEDEDKACISGRIETVDYKETKSGKFILMMDVSDNTSTICCKAFLDSAKKDIISGRIFEGEYIKLSGRCAFDMYSKELGIMANNIMQGIKPEGKEDLAEKKRVELHMHTQMSAMDGVSSATSIVKRAIKWGHKAVAITDHGVAQSFPEANLAALDKENNLQIKVIYGVEGYLISDVDPTINAKDTFVIFDLETTGFNAGTDGITEIGAVKIKDGKEIGEFSTFVNPGRHIPKEVQELTHITEQDIKDAPDTETALKDFLDFVGDSTVVAHNAKFDMSFIKYFCEKYKLETPKYVIDTLEIARELFEGYENHKLGTIANNLNISLEGAHRAVNDAAATGKIFLKMGELLEEKNIDLMGYVQTEFMDNLKDKSPYHIIVLAKNAVGLKNLYKIISFSHIRYFYKKPRLPRSLLNRYREGLIVGSACERGELFQAVLNNDENKEQIAKYYDYLEVQPLDNNKFYITNNIVKSNEDLQNINKEIINIGDKLGLPTVATCDVHFLDPEDEKYRRIIMAGQGYDDADNQAPLYFRTTDEMLKEFEYLPKEKAKEIVIDNPNKIADMVEEIRPVVSGTYNPVIEGSDEEIERLTYTRAKEIYGDPLPEIVEARIKKELTSIITHGFSVMYIIAQKLVKKSNDDGYLVGSRGSVGSSFVATMSGITEVNPLPAHYVCSECKYSEFPETTVTTGVDMVDKSCPKCGHMLRKDGMDIPFETFLGFKGDKVPDIDLNFSGDYQSKAHDYTEVLFGKSKTFRAGTISTVADKTAYGFVKKYYESKNKHVLSPEINRIAKCCTGIKRTTGQHPGGIIVVPRDKEIYDFCPVQRPADDLRTKTITTHFDFHSIHDNLLKLDILGHDDPTVIRMLEDLTGLDAKKIPLDEPKVMSIFSSTEALGVGEKQIKSKVGTYAVPEFGTKFVRQMLVDTRPTTFGELVRISGLSHGTDVWLGNAQTLIEEGKTTLSNAICTRDDIMIYLMQMGLDPSLAFKIMEIVRKGKALKLLTDEMQDEMRAKGVPEWYIDSCKKIKYMFPKAHACAYVMMAYRIAYFKVYYPEAFYATYLTIRANMFNSDIMCNGKEKVKEAIKEFETNPAATQTEKDTITVLEVVNEMLERGIEFLPIDIYKSDSTKFLVEDGKIRPPLSSIPTFGTVNAVNIVKARENGKFSSKENLLARAKLGKVGIELLDKCGCIKGMPASSQVSLFE